MINININGAEYEAHENEFVLDVALRNGVPIPALCHHPTLSPAGACKLCVVEAEMEGGRHLTTMACLLKVKQGMSVTTESEKVNAARNKAFAKLIKHAPQSFVLRDLAARFGMDAGPEPDGCIRCRLCVRVCNEVVKAKAIKMKKKDDGHVYVVAAKDTCIGCGTCANICPTGCIRVEDEGNERSILIRDEVIGRHTLERCAGCGKYFATPRFLHHIQELTGPHPHAKNEQKFCPTCSKLFSGRIGAIRR